MSGPSVWEVAAPPIRSAKSQATLDLVGIRRDTLVTEFRALGVQKSRPLMVHASMRAIGPVEGGADTVLDALLDAIGPGGTLVMLLCADDDEPFDAHESEVDVEDMGILAERFRRRAGAGVSDHAAARFAAIGPLADALLENVPLHDYYGRDSPLDRLVRHRGSVLRLGANIDTVTLTHHAEYLAALRDKSRVVRRYVRADRGEQWIASLDDTDGIARWDKGDYFGQILIDYLEANRAVLGPIGRCRAELLDGRDFTAFSKDWLERTLGGDTAEVSSASEPSS